MNRVPDLRTQVHSTFRPIVQLNINQSLPDGAVSFSKDQSHQGWEPKEIKTQHQCLVEAEGRVCKWVELERAYRTEVERVYTMVKGSQATQRELL